MKQFIFWGIVILSAFGAKDPLAATQNRIVSLAPDLTELVYALNLEKNLVGVTQFSDTPIEAKKIPRVGSFISPNTEKILVLKPTHILARRGATPTHVLKFFQNQKIQVLSFRAEHEDHLIQTLETLGKTFHTEKKAGNLIKEIKKELSRTNLQSKLRVLVVVESVPFMVAGKKTLLHRALELSGGQNAARQYTGYVKLQMEAVYRLNPDLILVPTTHGQEEKIKILKQKWPKIKVALIDGDILTRLTPRWTQGIQKLSKIIHDHP